LIARSEIAGAGEESPTISAVFLYLRPTGASSLEMAIVARNNADADLWVKADRIGVFGRFWSGAHIVDKDIRGDVFQLPPGRDVVIPLEIGATFEDEIVAAKAPSSVQLSAPLLFSAVDSSGHWQQLGVDPQAGQEVSSGQLEVLLTTMEGHLRHREDPAYRH